MQDKHLTITTMQYKAFISYSHDADGELASKLHSSLHSFAKPWYRLRAIRVFRDKTSLSANPGLWSSIEKALSTSEYLLLLASPKAVISPWIEREIKWWLKNRSIDNMIILLADGDIVWNPDTNDFDWNQTTAISKNLSGEFAEEPLYVDLRWTKEQENLSLRHSQFRSSILDIAAPLHSLPKEDLDSEDVRQHRKTRRLAGFAILLLIALLVSTSYAAYSAFRQAQIAENRRQEAVIAQEEEQQQRELAEKRFDEALRVADLIIFRIDKELWPIAGAASTRKTLLAEASGLLDGLKLDSGYNLHFFGSRMAAYGQRGQLALERNDLEEATRLFTTALEFGAEILKRDSSDAIVQRNMTALLNGISDVFLASGEGEQARIASTKSLKVLKSLASASPSDPDLRRGIAVTYNRVGDAEMALRNWTVAIEVYKNSLLETKKLASGDTNNTQWKHDLVATYLRLGVVSYIIEDFDASREAYQESLVISEELSEAEPNNAQFNRSAALSYSRLGDVERASKNWIEAKKNYEKSLAISESLVAAYPENGQWQHDVIVMYQRLGYIAGLKGRLSDARRAFTVSLEKAESLVNQGTYNAVWLKTLFMAHATLAEFLSQSGGSQKEILRQLDLARDILDQAQARTLFPPDEIQRMRQSLGSLERD